MNWSSKDGVILELQIPTKWIEISDNIKNLKDIRERFENPEEFKEWLLKNKGDQSLIGFQVPHKVPIHYITGVHDREICDSKEFIPLKSENQRDYIDVRNALQREKVPSNPSMGKGYKDGELYQEARHQAENSEERIELMKLIDEIVSNYYSFKHEDQNPHFKNSPDGIYPAIESALNDIIHRSEKIIEQKKQSKQKGLIGKLLSFGSNEKIGNEIELINERIEFCYRNYPGLDEKRELSRIAVEDEKMLMSVLNNFISSIEDNLGSKCNQLRNEVRQEREELKQLKSHVAKDENIEENIRKEVESFREFGSDPLNETLKSLSLIDLE